MNPQNTYVLLGIRISYLSFLAKMTGACCVELRSMGNHSSRDMSLLELSNLSFWREKR